MKKSKSIRDDVQSSLAAEGLEVSWIGVEWLIFKEWLRLIKARLTCTLHDHNCHYLWREDGSFRADCQRCDYTFDSKGEL